MQKSHSFVADQWLSEIIGREVYRVNFCNVQGDDVNEFKDSLKPILTKKPVFLYSKAPVSELIFVKSLVEVGFHLVDSNITFEKDALSEASTHGKVSLRFANKDDMKDAMELGRNNFVYTRFHQDKNIPGEIANAIKAEWIGNFFKGLRGEQFVVAEIENTIVGLLQLLIDNAGNLIIDQIAVDKNSRRMGVATDMIAFVENQNPSAEKIKVGTQIANIPSMRMYENIGFRVIKAEYVLHFHNNEK